MMIPGSVDQRRFRRVTWISPPKESNTGAAPSQEKQDPTKPADGNLSLILASGTGVKTSTNTTQTTTTASAFTRHFNSDICSVRMSRLGHPQNAQDPHGQDGPKPHQDRQRPVPVGSRWFVCYERNKGHRYERSVRTLRTELFRSVTHINPGRGAEEGRSKGEVSSERDGRMAWHHVATWTRQSPLDNHERAASQRLGSHEKAPHEFLGWRAGEVT